MTSLVQNRIIDPSATTHDASDLARRLAAHRRDVDLFERLFSNWTRHRLRHTTDAHQTLDAIEAQLARLEQAVRMTTAA